MGHREVGWEEHVVSVLSVMFLTDCRFMNVCSIMLQNISYTLYVFFYIGQIVHNITFKWPQFTSTYIPLFLVPMWQLETELPYSSLVFLSYFPWPSLIASQCCLPITVISGVRAKFPRDMVGFSHIYIAPSAVSTVPDAGLSISLSFIFSLQFEILIWPYCEMFLFIQQL